MTTDRDIFRFGEDAGEMFLSSEHPGVTVKEVGAEVGWPLDMAPDVKTSEPPTVEGLKLILEGLDPNGAYTRK